MLLFLKTKIYSKEVDKELNTLEICKSYLKEFIARKNEEFVLKEKTGEVVHDKSSDSNSIFRYFRYELSKRCNIKI